MPELLDLEMSFEEINGLPLANHIVLPINADIEKYKNRILKLQFPLWIKLNSSQHKVKINAVEKCNNFSELERAYKNFQNKFPGKKFIIQENIEGLSLIAGIKEDKTFGRILMLGTGGTYTELIKDIEFRVLPLERQEILEALENLQIYRLLKEKNIKIDKLLKLIEKFSKLDLIEADLNPIIVNEKEVKIVDARVVI